MSSPSAIRNVFDYENEQSAEWKESIKSFPNHVPRFDTKTEAIEFTKKHCLVGSNVDDPGLLHSITTFTNWQQIQTHILPKLKQNERFSVDKVISKLSTKLKENNRFYRPRTSNELSNSEENEDAYAVENNSNSTNTNNNERGYLIHNYLQSRLNLPIHQIMNYQSTLNTFHYLFNHMRCGILVAIRQQKVLIFCPFVNQDYTNNWGETFPEIESEDGSLNAYYASKDSNENIIPDKSKWWANGNIICNVYDQKNDMKNTAISTSASSSTSTGNTASSTNNNQSSSLLSLGQSNQWWGDHFLLQLKDMMVETCENRMVPDCDFFINKRDYPQLKYHLASTSSLPSSTATTTVSTTTEVFAATTATGTLRNDVSQPVEPYGFIFNKDDKDPNQDIPLTRELYKTYAPILSFYSSDRFADIPIPPSEDWEAATGKVYPASFIPESISYKTTTAATSDTSTTTDTFSDEISSEAVSTSESESTTLHVEVATPRDLFTPSNLQKFNCAWENKINTAFFRGTATGGGTTVDTNQRLKAAQLSSDWSLDPKLNGGKGGKNNKSDKNKSKKVDESNDSDNEDDDDSNNERVESKTEAAATATVNDVPYLDAKITAWNRRDKKIASQKMTFIRPNQFKFTGGRQNFIEIYKQSSFKYLLYIEGHCAACRYGFMMLLDSVILKVDSTCVADQMWYFPLLQPYIDHVPVKADFSNLLEQIEWCRQNDEKCRQIAQNAKNLYSQYISREGILDYMQSIFYEISSRYIIPPDYASYAPIEEKIPFLPTLCDGNNCSKNKNEMELCRMCQETKKKAVENDAKKNEKSDQIKERKRLKKQREIEEVRLKKQRLMLT